MPTQLAHVSDNGHDSLDHMGGMMGDGVVGGVVFAAFWVLLLTIMVLAIVWLLKEIQKKK